MFAGGRDPFAWTDAADRAIGFSLLLRRNQPLGISGVHGEDGEWTRGSVALAFSLIG
jgi:hypothetical protein